MWCEKCNYGSETMKHSGIDFRCPQCQNKTFVTSSPFPKNRTTSIHPSKQNKGGKEKVTIVK
jgi:phage FluMu protein Com